MEPSIFETLSPSRLFFRCAIPSMISMAFSSLYTIADGIFVGHFLGKEALAAVNLVMPLIIISFALADMVAVGSSVQISILLGKRDKENACRTFTSCILLIFLVSFPIGALGFFYSETMLIMFGAENSVALLASEYIRVFAVFAPLITIFFSIDNYLRICGRQNYSMFLNIATALLNIILDYIFIVVMGKGIESAALASCLSLTLGTILGISPFIMKKLDLNFVKGRIPLKQFGRLFANGSSELLTNIASSLLMLILNFVLLRLGGTVAIASVSVVMYIDSLIGMMIFGIIDSMQPAISYCYGARLYKRLISLEKMVIYAAATLSVVAIIIMLNAGEFLIALFIKPGDKALLEMSLRAMHLFVFSYLVSWVDACFGSFLTALDCPVRSIVVTLSGSLIFPLLCILFMVPIFNIDGVWLMPLASSVLSSATALILSRPLWNKCSSS